MEQIIKFGISNYLQLCVEAGFSQIQSHILCVKSVALHLVGLMAAWLVVRHVKSRLSLKLLKLAVIKTFDLYFAKVQHCSSNFNTINMLFQLSTIARSVQSEKF